MTTSKRPYEPIILGADIGNATTTVVAHEPKSVSFFPSFIATMGVGAYEGLSKIATSRHHVSVGTRHALIGTDALDAPGADTLLANYGEDAGKRYVDDASLYCLLAGISSAFVEVDALGIRLATGAPLSLYKEWAPAIKRRYQGEHRYTYNGHQRALVVRDVQVYGEGRELLRLLPPEERRGRVAVHDIGGRTWNVLLFKDGALVGEGVTFDMGVERLFSQVASLPADPGARWYAQQEMRRSPKAHAAARAELDALIGQALDTIERKVRIDKAERHVLGGGGAMYLPDVLRRRYKVPAMVLGGDAPETANALAYALAAAEGS